MGILSWLTRRRLDLDEEDFKEEIRAHLAIDRQERMDDGADATEAHYAALREFGNVTLTTEAARGVWTPRWLEGLRTLLSDGRYGIRTLSKNPIFALTVIGVLTLGIGLNAAVFTMVKALALTPVAGVENSARLAVVVGETASGRKLRISYPDYQHLRDSNRAFTDLYGSIVATVGLGRGRASRSLWSELVTGNYFQVLGVNATLGRTLMPSDEAAPGRQPVVVISDGLWRRDFNADPAIVGRTIEINDQPLTIVGVVDASFHGTTVVYDVELFIPVTMAPQLGFNFGSRETTPAGILSDRGASMFYPQGRLRANTTLAAASAEMDALWRARSNERPVAEASDRLRVVPFRETPNGALTYVLPTLVVLSATGLLVLLIACANIAGLVLVRGVSRRGEMAVRLALGASRARIVRLLMAENLVLAIPGGLLGILLAEYGIPVLVAYAEALAAPQRIFFNIESDALVVAFAVAAACGSALVFGLVPALRSSRVDLVAVINQDASPRGAVPGRMRASLVVAQVAVSLVLLTGAGLVMRSLDAARRANLGYDAARVTSVAVDLKQNGYDVGRGRTFYRNLLDAARADTTVESATLAAVEPMNFLDTVVQTVMLEGYQPRSDEDLVLASNIVASGYFRTLRIPILSGREFEDRDDERAAPVIIVNKTLADRFWGGTANAIGKRVRLPNDEWRTVVGVGTDVKYTRINEAPRPYLYVPFLQAYRHRMILHTRTAAFQPALSDDQAVARARSYIAALDPDLPIIVARPLVERIAGALIFFNLTATMLSIFGVAGMLLAAMGTYGLVSYSVRQSTHEIGIRLALGASASAVVRQFIARGLRLGTIGAVLGIFTALAASRFLGSVLFGVSPTDPVSFSRALAVVLGGVVIATVVPAWRASRTNPLQALRHQ